MTGRWSRRGFLLALGGGATVALLIHRFSGPESGTTLGGPGGGANVAGTSTYVDHDGWILTVDDKRRLAPSPGEAPDIRED